MSTYLKNMTGYKHNQLKSKSYDEIQEMFDKEMKREKVKKQKGDNDQEETEMKRHIEIVKNDEVEIDAIPLATKPLVIVDYKIDKDGRMGYFKLIRADGSSKRYSSMIKMLQGIDREDLETLWKLVKAKHENTRPEDDYERVLWGDLKLIADEEPVLQPVEVTIDSGGSPKPELFVVHPGSVAARIKDRKCKTKGGSSRPPVKRKLESGSLNSRATRAKTSTSKDDVPFLIVSDDDEAIVENAMNRRSCELLEVIEKLRGECEPNRDCLTREDIQFVYRSKRTQGQSCQDDVGESKVASYQASLSTLELQIASLEAEKARLEAVEVSLRKEVDDVKWDRMEVISKVVPYAAMNLMHNDDLGSLVGRLVSSAIFYGRCKAFEQVARMKEPFILLKVKGYRPLYKKEDNQAGNDLTTATFPWLSEFVADPSALVEEAFVPSKACSLGDSSSCCLFPKSYSIFYSRLNEKGHHVGKKDCVTFNPLQISVNMPSQKCFLSFELIIHGTLNLHTMYSHTNLSACLSLIVVRGFASTHFMECSIGIAKIFKPLGAIGKGPRMLTPQLLTKYSWIGVIQLSSSLVLTCRIFFSSIDLFAWTSISTSLVRCSKVIEASLLNASAYFTLIPSDVFDRIAVKALQGLFCLLQVFSDHWLLGCVAALMLSVKAIRYIIRTSPCIGAMSISKSSTNFFISWSAASASASTPLDRKRLRAANFPLRLYFSSTTMVLGIYVISAWVHAKTSALDIRRSHSLSLKCFDENPFLWNLMAPWMVETTIPIFCIAVLPSNILYDESDLTMTNNELPLSMCTRPTSLPKSLDFITTGAEELLPLVTEGNVISLPPEMKSSDTLYFMYDSFCLIMSMGASAGEDFFDLLKFSLRSFEAPLDATSLALIHVRYADLHAYSKSVESHWCINEMERGLAQMPLIVGVSHVLRDNSRNCVPRSLSWRESLYREGDRGTNGKKILFEGRPSSWGGGYVINHQALNELDHPKLTENLEPVEVQDNVINESINEDQPSPTTISPSGEPLAGITTRSRIRDSEATSTHKCLYEWINYKEIFAPVARLEAIRIFLAYAAYMGFMVYQMDVKSAFLNRKISEEVYVQQPPGFESSEFPNHVCKLDKALYGLRQALKAWYLKGTPNLGLWYPKGSGFDLKADSNSDYARCNLDRKSTSGGCQVLGGNEKCVSIPPKETVKAGLATQGLFDKDHQSLSSTDLVKSSPILFTDLEGSFIGLEIDIGQILFSNRIAQLNPRKKGRKPNICYTRYLSLIIEHLLGESYHNDKLKTFKPHHITAISFKTPYKKDSPLTAHMCIVAELSPEPVQSLLPLFGEVNADDSIDKSLFGTSMQPSIYASESVEELGNQPKTAEAEKVLEINVEKERAVQVLHESRYDTESEIKVIKRCQPPQNNDEDQITFVGAEYVNMEEVANFDLHSMPDDESAKATTDNILDETVDHKASAYKPSDLIGPLKESVPRMVTDAFEERMPELLNDTLKSIIPNIIEETIQQALLKFDQRIQETLKSTEELLKAVRNKVGKSVKKTVWKEIDIVKDRLSYYGDKLDKAKAEGEKVSFEEDIALEISKKAKAVEEAKAAEEDKAAAKAAKEAMGEQTSVQEQSKPKEAPPISEEEPPSKRLKFLIPNLSTTLPNPLSLILPQNITLDQFTSTLFNTTSSEYSPTPPRDESIGNGIATEENPLKDLIPLIDEGGPALKMPNVNPFSTSEEGKMTIMEVKAQLKEMQRLAMLKQEKEKSKARLKVLTPAEIRARA
ncbi:retrovirus-related pol polyprotein from transposon TNT 1-94 [Tanacetum coccineum]